MLIISGLSHCPGSLTAELEAQRISSVNALGLKAPQSRQHLISSGGF